MQIIHDETVQRHDPQFFLVRGVPTRSPERPERATVLVDAVRQAGHQILAPESHGPGPRAAIHSPEYLDFLAQAHQQWQSLPGASAEITPNIHPNRYQGHYPRSIVGRAGYHMADTACPLGEHTYAAACASADCAVEAAIRVLGGEPAVYALCRPPGHHAYADMAGGFCFLNNSAIAAQVLRGRCQRVAILDVDVHHGNGTQGIFYQRPDVYTLSLHADPRDYYPFFWGHAQERGEGAGLGYNLNLPLPLGTGDGAYLQALGELLRPLGQFAPEALVVALGLDTYQGDPLQGMTISTPGFARIGEIIGGLRLPTVLVQEGGYPCPELGANLVNFLQGFSAARD